MSDTLSLAQDFARDCERIIDSNIDVVSWSQAVSRCMEWAEKRHPSLVCIVNVHSVVTAKRDKTLAKAINDSDLATPDGMPLAWLISRRRGKKQERVNGPDLTLRLCREAALKGIPVAFYGSSESTLYQLKDKLEGQFPDLIISALISPPFRDLTPEEDVAMVERLKEGQPGLVFVGLGCPKQEAWMLQHTGQIEAVMIGVGAAFDYIAGTVKRPPVWMQRAGLE